MTTIDMHEPAAPPASARRSEPARRARRRLLLWPMLFMLPALVMLIAFHFLPVTTGAYYAFTNWDGLTVPKFVGLDNFHRIFEDRYARGALVHTLQVAILFLIIVSALGMALAVGLNRAVKSRSLLRSLFYAPAIVSPLAVALTWQYLLTSRGLVNQVLGWVGLQSWQHSWLADPNTAIWTVLVVLVWQYSGLAMVIYLAGLQTIPDELYEAAALDGAGPLTQFRRITFPLLTPAVTVCSTLMLVLGLRVFDQVMALTGGGPVYASDTLATQIYQETFVLGHYGYGSALALTLTVVITGLSFLQLAVLRKRQREV